MLKRGFLVLFSAVYILMLVCAPGTSLANNGDTDTDAEDAGRGAASNVPAPVISAPSALLMEAETGQVLYENPKPLVFQRPISSWRCLLQ